LSAEFYLTIKSLKVKSAYYYDPSKATRAGGVKVAEPYVTHPLAVAEFLSEFGWIVMG